jgi:hypothetical protein
MKTSLTEVTFELIERKPDIEQTSPNDRVVNHSGHRQDRNAAAQRSAAVPYGVLTFQV